MPFSTEQIATIDNLYEALGDADNLAKHSKELNALSADDKKKVAIKLVQQCPEKDLSHLGLAMQALKASAAKESEETFYRVVTQAWTVRKTILALKNPRNPHPHILLLEPEFNSDFFAAFKDHALALLTDNEIAIAQKLALSTPAGRRSELAQNINNIFSGSEFATVVSTALMLRKELDVLLGNEPYKFFISPEFNSETCLKYNKLLGLITNKDEQIAAKLATTPNSRRETVLSNMKLIFPNSSLLEQTEEVFKTPAKEAVHSSSLFAPAPPQEGPKEKEKDPQISLSF